MQWLAPFVSGLSPSPFSSRVRQVFDDLSSEHLQEVISLLSNEPKATSLPLTECKEVTEVTMTDSVNSPPTLDRFSLELLV